AAASKKVEDKKAGKVSTTSTKVKTKPAVQDIEDVEEEEETAEEAAEEPEEKPAKVATKPAASKPATKPTSKSETKELTCYDLIKAVQTVNKLLEKYLEATIPF